MVEDGLHEKQGGMFVSRYEVSRAAQCSSNQQQMPELWASSCPLAVAVAVAPRALPCLALRWGRGKRQGKARQAWHGRRGR